ncbi:MAG TPA: hypothetical protein VKE70_01090, partial [Candidatus Solibacter sp.]|nr:hypothetical protein [Candidatus Solibacter sp.]
MRIFFTVIVTIAVLLGALTIGGYAYLKTHPFSARAKPSGLETSLARTVRYVSSPAGSHTLANPVPATEDAIAEGRRHY